MQVIQEQKKVGANTSVLLIFIDTPEKARQKYRETGRRGVFLGERKEKKKSTHDSGLNSHGEGGFEDCACWSGEV